MGVNHKFIAGAIKRPGNLHRELGVKPGHKIPEKKMEAAEKKPGLVGEEARFAENVLKKEHKK